MENFLCSVCHLFCNTDYRRQNWLRQNAHFIILTLHQANWGTRTLTDQLKVAGAVLPICQSHSGLQTLHLHAKLQCCASSYRRIQKPSQSTWVPRKSSCRGPTSGVGDGRMPVFLGVCRLQVSNGVFRYLSWKEHSSKFWPPSWRSGVQEDACSL